MLDSIDELAGFVYNPTKIIIGRKIYEKFCRSMTPVDVNADHAVRVSLSVICTKNGDLQVEVVDEDIITIK